MSKVDENVWAVCTGLAGDGRAIVRLMRKVCMNYRSKFGSAPTLQYLATIVSEMQHDFTSSGNERPYGVSVLLVGYDEGSIAPRVFLSSVDGTVTQWLAASAGRAADKCWKLLGDRLDWGRNGGEESAPTSEVAAKLIMEALNLPGVAKIGEEEDAKEGQPVDLYKITRASVGASATISSQDGVVS